MTIRTARQQMQQAIRDGQWASAVGSAFGIDTTQAQQAATIQVLGALLFLSSIERYGKRGKRRPA